jgi:hypothetical protein
MPNTTIASNAVGVYVLDTPQTEPIPILTGTTLTGTNAPTGSVAGEYMLVKTSAGVFLGVGKVTAAGSPLTSAAADLVLVGAATSTSIEAASSISEVAARTGVGTSSMFISSGASSWSSTIDGLVYVTDDTYEGTPITAIDAANAKYFVILKFEIAANEGYIGQGLIENASITAAVDDISTYSVSVKGYGDLIKL